jgi:hypothetical protein
MQQILVAAMVFSTALELILKNTRTWEKHDSGRFSRRPLAVSKTTAL